VSDFNDVLELFEKAETTEVLHWASLTPAVNEIKSPNAFLKKLLFTQAETKSTEKIELSFWTGGRQTAPFVRKNGEAILVDGYGESFATVETPNIRIKRAIHPHQVMFERRPGTVIFPTRGEQTSAMDNYLALQSQRLSDLATNAEEWLCAMALRGVITYSVADQEVFQITYPKPAGNTVVLTTFWDDADPSLPEIEKDFYTAKKLISDEVGLVPTDVILGSEAVLSFMKVLKHQQILNMLHLDAGAISLQTQFREDGAIYLGIFCGIKVWAYPRQVTHNGAATDLIRAKYAEFVCATAAAENVLYYGAVADDDALEGGLFVTQRFAKSFKTPDPSQRFLLLHTRPLPCTRRPGSIVSMKVISG
jgi:hypothetical protein